MHSTKSSLTWVLMGNRGMEQELLFTYCIFSWMVANKLSVNPNKTEYPLFNPKHFNNPNCSINIDSNIISSNNSTKNLGVVFHSDISMDKHISAIVKSCFFQLQLNL